MGSYTALHLVSVDTPEWIPDRLFMTDVLEHLGTTCVHSFSGYSVPLYWEDGYEYLKHVVFQNLDWRVDIDTAFDLWEEHKPVFAGMSVFVEGYGKQLFDALEQIPEEIGYNTAIGNAGLDIGPFSIPSEDSINAHTIGRFSFAVNLSGDGAPQYSLEYQEAVRENSEMKRLLDWLQEKSGKRWDILIRCSYG